MAHPGMDRGVAFFRTELVGPANFIFEAGGNMPLYLEAGTGSIPLIKKSLFERWGHRPGETVPKSAFMLKWVLNSG